MPPPTPRYSEVPCRHLIIKLRQHPYEVIDGGLRLALNDAAVHQSEVDVLIVQTGTFPEVPNCI